MEDKTKSKDIIPSKENKNEISNEELLKRLDAAVNERKAEIITTSSVHQNNKEAGEDKDTKTSKNDDEGDKAFDSFLKIALIIFIIALIIITVGWLFSKLNKPEYEDAVIVEEEDELDVKKKRLTEVETEIAPLELKKAKIQKNEKRILIGARLLIGLIMVAVNIWFANTYIYFDGTFELNKLLSFNSAILLCYSFIAFISYGTPTNFVAALKNTIGNVLKRRHIDTLTELEKLVKERNILLTEIEVLEKNKK